MAIALADLFGKLKHLTHHNIESTLALFVLKTEMLAKNV